MYIYKSVTALQAGVNPYPCTRVLPLAVPSPLARVNPYPWPRVRVFEGKGKGQKVLPWGYPCPTLTTPNGWNLLDDDAPNHIIRSPRYRPSSPVIPTPPTPSSPVVPSPISHISEAPRVSASPPPYRSPAPSPIPE